MGITETTVKVHRSNMMRKVKANSFAELCRMVDQLKRTPEDSE
jgi:FixJ family two-component response regulator